jgi:3-oxoadipate enol-lactonase
VLNGFPVRGDSGDDIVDETFGVSRQFETVAGRLAVFQVGKGERTIIFWPSVFADHTMYRQQAVVLADEFRMIFIDGPGHGGSGPQKPGATLDTHASAVIDVMDQLQVANSVFVGTSWGGLVGVHLVRLYPKRVAALVALNTPFDTRKGGPSIAVRMIVLLARLAGTTGLFANGVSGSFFAPSSKLRNKAQITEFKSRLAGFRPVDMAVVARGVLLERESELTSLGRIAAPTLVVAGREDSNVSSVDLQQASNLIPDARFVEIPYSAHLSALEAPDAVNLLIRDFCRHLD